MTAFNPAETKKALLILAFMILLLAVWGAAIATWGYGAIIIPALALTLASLLALIFVTRG